MYQKQLNVFCFENNFFIDCEITNKVQKRLLTMPLTGLAHWAIIQILIDQ